MDNDKEMIDQAEQTDQTQKLEEQIHPLYDSLANPRSQLGGLVGSLLPRGRVVALDTAEGQMISACIEGLLTGLNEMGETEDARDDAMSRTDITNPGCIEMMRRECMKLAVEGSGSR
jgi:hypothetical protein